MTAHPTKRAPCGREGGFTILEVMVAAVILLVGIVGVVSLFAIAVAENTAQGDLATRATEYSQDKMEQLLALSFTDGSTNTTVYPPANTGGTGLGGAMGASTTVGGVTPGSPVSGYADYLDTNGTLLSSSTGAFYSRQWSIAADSTGNLKTITVLTTVNRTPATPAAAPSTTLVCLKSNTQ